MNTGFELAKKGLCEICQAKVQHGPYTDAQIQEISEDLGTEVADFSDWCDDCFVGQVGRGDAVYAESLAKRRLEVTKPEYAEQLRHSRFIAAGQALQEFRAKHGPGYRRSPDSIPLFEEFLKYAPPEVYQKFLDKAKDLDLMPETKFVNDAGEPVVSAEQLAEKWGLPLSKVEAEMRERFADKIESGNIHRVQ